MKLFSKALGMSLFLFMAGQAFSAVPPLSEEARMAGADLVVEGTVIKVEEAIVPAPPTTEKFSNLVFKVQMNVEHVVKGETADPTVDFGYWKIHSRPRGWAGPQGQNSKVVVGTRIRAYLVKGESEFSLMKPNGFEDLTPKPTTYTPGGCYW